MRRDAIEAIKESGRNRELRQHISNSLWKAGKFLEAAMAEGMKNFPGAIADAKSKIEDAEQLYAELTDR